MNLEACAPLIATLPLEVDSPICIAEFFCTRNLFVWPYVICINCCIFNFEISRYLILHYLIQVRGKIGDFITSVFTVFQGIVIFLTKLIVIALVQAIKTLFRENKSSYPPPPVSSLDMLQFYNIIIGACVAYDVGLDTFNLRKLRI